MKSRYTERIGRALATLRKAEGSSQDDFADKSGLSKNTVKRIEKGEIGCLSNLQVYALSVGLNLEELFAVRLEERCSTTSLSKTEK